MKIEPNAIEKWAQEFERAKKNKMLRKTPNSL